MGYVKQAVYPMILNVVAGCKTIRRVEQNIRHSPSLTVS